MGEKWFHLDICYMIPVGIMLNFNAYGIFLYQYLYYNEHICNYSTPHFFKKALYE